MYEHNLKYICLPFNSAKRLSLNFEISKLFLNIYYSKLSWNVLPNHRIFHIETKVYFRNMSLRIGANL